MAVNQLPSAEVGGVGLFSAHLAGALQIQGHELLLLGGTEEQTAGPSRLEQVEPAAPGVRTLRLVRSAPPARLGILSGIVNPAVDALLEQAVREHKPDLVHIQHTLQLSARLTSIGVAAGAAVVASVHDYWPICQRIDLRRAGSDGDTCDGPRAGARCAMCVSHGEAGPLTRSLRAAGRLGPYLLRTQVVQGCYARAHRITCPAPDVVRRLAAQGFDAGRMMVVDYGIPPLPPGVATIARPGTPLRLGYLGSLGPHKGVRVALRAMEQLAHVAVTLQVRGGPLRDASLRSELERLEELGLARYLGPYTEGNLPGILAGLDALVIPSIWPETGPMVWMEAVSAGLPVIASAVGALPGRVRHGEDGLLVPPGDPVALAGAVEQLISQYDLLRRGTMARTVRGLDDVVHDLEQVYDEAIKEAQAS